MLQKLVTLLFISGDPIPVATLATLLEVPVQEVEKELPSAVIVLRDVGLDLLQGPEGVTIVTQAQNASLVEAFWKQELQGDLTPAALQVLTLVGYLENPTREEISYVRGVQSSQSIPSINLICTASAGFGFLLSIGEHVIESSDSELYTSTFIY